MIRLEIEHPVTPPAIMGALLVCTDNERGEAQAVRKKVMEVVVTGSVEPALLTALKAKRVFICNGNGAGAADKAVLTVTQDVIMLQDQWEGKLRVRSLGKFCHLDRKHAAEMAANKIVNRLR